ncbi:CARDB domain-containing protein [Archaeoglobus neptunius]|uniref:CARDB domain-containing protein n=1 Tax=Archaeoglobus neptunius TaxID=2798580 RepID=UPI0019270C51|nr:CARDB domain-containing protein [Archaeoglobus neptunius]
MLDPINSGEGRKIDIAALTLILLLTVPYLSIVPAHAASIVSDYIWPGGKVIVHAYDDYFAYPYLDRSYMEILGTKYSLHDQAICPNYGPTPHYVYAVAPTNIGPEGTTVHVKAAIYVSCGDCVPSWYYAEKDLVYPTQQPPTFSLSKLSGNVGDSVTIHVGGGPLYPKSYTVTYSFGSIVLKTTSFSPNDLGTFTTTCYTHPSGTSYTFTVPTLPQGTYTVKATVSGLADYLPTEYTVGQFEIFPKLYSASKNTSTQEVGLPISISFTGKGYAANTAYQVKVKIGSLYATVSPTTVTSNGAGVISGTVTAIVPHGLSAGSKSVTLYIGSKSINVGTLTVKQGISSATFTPTNANVGSTIVVKFSGSAYAANTQYSPTLTIDGVGVSLSPSKVQTDSNGQFNNAQFSFTIPNIPGGSKEVKLTVGTSTRIIGYLNVVPLITTATMDKTSGKVGSTFTITASGNGFPTTTQPVSVKIGGIKATVSPNSVSPSTSGDFNNKMFTVTVPDVPYGTHQVQLTIGSTSTVVGSYTIQSSLSASIDKTRATYGETVKVTLNGNGLPNSQLNVIVKVGDNQVTPSPQQVTPTNGKINTQVSFTVPTLPLDNYPVTVTLSSGSFSITANAGTLTLQGVDLHVSSATVTSTPLVGKQTSISFTVQNSGNLPASNVKVNVLANENVIGTTYVTLSAYGSTQAEVPWTPNAPGQTEIRIVVDPDNSVAELYENNNEFSTYVIVKHINLAIQSVDAPSQVLLNHQYTFKVTIANTGDYPSESFTVAFKENGVTTQSSQVTNVDPSSTVISTFTWTPTNIGTTTIEIVVDSANMIAESNESDNSYKVSYSILAPELKIENVDIPELVYGAETTIKVRVSNSGNMQADTDITILEGNSVASTSVASISAGETSTVNLTYTPDVYGSFQLTVCVDYNNAFSEPNEDDNCYTTTVTTKAPNLKASLDVPSSVEMKEGGVPVNITITNDGNYNAGAFTVLIDYSYGSEVRRISSLAPQESVSIQTNLDLPVGYHTITVTVDASDEVKESNENDNIVSKSITVTGADLAITSVDIPETIPLGKTAEITVNVENKGTVQFDSYNLTLKVNGKVVQNVTTSLNIVTLQYTPNETGALAIEVEAYPVGAFDVDTSNNRVVETMRVTAPDLYLSVVAPEVVDAQNPFTVTVSVKNQGDGPANGFSLIATYGDQIQTKQALSCDPDKTLTYTFTFTALKNESYLVVKVDPDNIIKETDENNNEFNRSIAVRVPDLRVSIDAPDSAPVNEKQTIQITVTNVGQIKGSGTVTVQVDNTTITSKTVTVDPMKSTTISAYYTPSKDKYSYGSHFTVTAKVETDFGTHTSTATVKVVAPDLTVDYISIPPEVTLGEETYITVRVTNKGDYRAGTFNLKLQNGGSTLGTVTIDGLSPGSSVSKSFRWTPQQLGKYTFEAIVDPENKVVEWDESNNKQTQTVVRAPDLVITGVATNETEFYTYSPYKVKVTVSNIGSAPAENVLVSMEYLNNTKSVTIGKLYPGNSTNVVLFFTPTSNGTVHVNITVDPLDSVMEVNEDNNVYETDFFVNEPPKDLNLTQAKLPEGIQERATMTLSWSMFGGYFACAGAIVYGITQFARTGGELGRKYIMLGILGAIILTSLNSAIGSF